jgi:hypothetical protein
MGSSPEIQPVGQVAGHYSGPFSVRNIGDRAVRGKAVKIDQGRNPVGANGGQGQGQRTTLGVANNGDSFGGYRVKNRNTVSNVSVPAVERGMLAIAMTTVIPGNDLPTLRRQQGGESVHGAGEIESAVGQQERTSGLRSPLVGSD